MLLLVINVLARIEFQEIAAVLLLGTTILSPSEIVLHTTAPLALTLSAKSAAVQALVSAIPVMEIIEILVLAPATAPVILIILQQAIL
jgi:hypothetical protein